MPTTVCRASPFWLLFLPLVARLHSNNFDLSPASRHTSLFRGLEAQLHVSLTQTQSFASQKAALPKLSTCCQSYLSA